MEASIRDEIYNWLSRYLAGQISLREFHDWFIPATWELDDQSEPAKLVHRIQLLLAEFANGDRLEDDLREALWAVVNRPTVTVFVGSMTVCSSSLSQTTQVASPSFPESAGKVSEAVFA
jgi:hypothetical protein